MQNDSLLRLWTSSHVFLSYSSCPQAVGSLLFLEELICIKSGFVPSFWLSWAQAGTDTANGQLPKESHYCCCWRKQEMLKPEVKRHNVCHSLPTILNSSFDVTLEMKSLCDGRGLNQPWGVKSTGLARLPAAWALFLWLGSCMSCFRCIYKFACLLLIVSWHHHHVRLCGEYSHVF